MTWNTKSPANPLLIETMYLCGTIERMGTGTEKLANLCLEKGLKRPKFIQENDFRVVLYRQAPKENTEGTEKQQLILDSIAQNQHVTILELVPIVGITARKENIPKLKAKGLLERVGTDKGGYWQIKT